MTTWVPGFRAAVAAAAAVLLVLLGGAGGLLMSPLLQDGDTSNPGAVDVGFGQDMMVHHQQAVSMSQLVTGRASPDVSNLARQIEAEQSTEIGQLQGLLMAWHASPVPDGAPMSWMPSGQHSGHHHAGHHDGPAVSGTDTPGTAGMPGMATQTELDDLRRLGGAELDVPFLQLMVRHHEGGLPMLAYAAEHASDPEVRDLAHRMILDQVDEGQLMLQLLQVRGAHPLPSPVS